MLTNTNDLRTCDRCQRRYHVDVYQRHLSANQCLKRNHPRTPFQSVKQRSIRVGDRIFSVQTQSQQPSHVQDRTLPTMAALSIHSEQRKSVVSMPTKTKQRIACPRTVESTSRRRTLEQAKQLLERRTRYKPPWIQQRSHTLDRTMSMNVDNQRLTNERTITSKRVSYARALPPTTTFLTDNLPIRGNIFISFD
jgi:hypothetical protein